MFKMFSFRFRKIRFLDRKLRYYINVSNCFGVNYGFRFIVLMLSLWVKVFFRFCY